MIKLDTEMENNSLLSLPREKCMKCREEGAILMSTCAPFCGVIGPCHHKFCESCFRIENPVGTICTFSCPCCHAAFFENLQSIDEAILIGEALTMTAYITPRLSIQTSIEAVDELSIIEFMHFCIHEENKVVVEKLEAALHLNPANFYSLCLLFRSCSQGHMFILTTSLGDSFAKYYRSKTYDYAFKLLDHPSSVADRYEIIRCDCYMHLAFIFQYNFNHPAALKYSKLAYEQCLRSSDHTGLSNLKEKYIQIRAAFAKLPPLRFAVGDEVEFLHELETGSEWKLGKVVELYYRARDFELTFNAPYRLQLLDDSESIDQPPVYAWVKADLDRYVRKVGVRSIEGTRYQARLDAKVEELSQVYLSKEFIVELYSALAQDRAFVEMLRSVWQIELSEYMLSMYRLLVIHRQPLVRAGNGYNLPSTEEVIAGIRAYFDPAHLSGDAAPSAVGLGRNTDSERIRAIVLRMLQCAPENWTLLPNDIFGAIDDSDAQWLLLRSIRESVELLDPGSATGLYDSNLTVPLGMSDAISKASAACDITIALGEIRSSRLEHLQGSWIGVHLSLENPDAGPACECPFVYFFVKACLDHSWGVPKQALALFDRMNMQLSREFIRCANPTCELNRLDKSTGQVKFKQCSRCRAVIYCSRECQVAHYPEHKRLCRVHSTGQEGS